MIIRISTIYKSNYGSFLQAFALKTYLESKGHQVLFVNDDFEELSKLGDNYSQEIYASLAVEYNKFIVSEDIQEDIRIVGSDEVWNLLNKHSAERKDFWETKDATKVIAYGACAIGSPWRKMICKAWRLNFFSLLSVRDDRSYKLIRPFVIKKITKVLDPTLLIDWNKYIIKPKQIKYVLVYSYGLETVYLHEIELYAQKKKLEVVYVQHKVQSDYGYCFAGNPFELLGLFKYAAAVFATTFHGTVLATYFRQKFICMKFSEKVKYYLKDMRLEDRICTEINEMESKMEEKIDYDSFTLKLEQKKRESYDYLRKALLVKR